MIFQITYDVLNRTTTVPIVVWKYQDFLTLQLLFVNTNNFPAGTVVSMAVKQAGTYDGTALLLFEDFAVDPQTGYWEQEALIDSDFLAQLFVGNPTEVPLLTDVLVKSGDDHIYQGPTQIVTIKNQVTRGEEFVPPPNPNADVWLASRAVLYDREQTLTTEQQEQARTNLGLGTGNSPTFTALTLSTLPTSAGAPGTLWRSGADVKVSL